MNMASPTQSLYSMINDKKSMFREVESYNQVNFNWIGSCLDSQIVFLEFRMNHCWFISTVRCSIPPPTRRSYPSNPTYRFVCFKPFYGNLNQLRQTKTGHLRPSKTIWDHPRPSETIRDHPRPSETIRDHWIPLNTNEYHWIQLKTIEYNQMPRPPETRTD